MHWTEEKLRNLDSFESIPPKNGGLCSDDDCPCDEIAIPRGEGHIFISESCANFRKNFRTQKNCEDKLNEMAEEFFRKRVIYMPAHNTYSAILVCEEGAKRRNLDLAVSSKDAELWWKEGRVPCRPTPEKKVANHPVKESHPLWPENPVHADGDEAKQRHPVSTDVALSTPAILLSHDNADDKLSDKKNKRYLKAGRLLQFLGGILFIVTVGSLVAVLVNSSSHHPNAPLYPSINDIILFLLFSIFYFMVGTAIKAHKKWGRRAGILLGLFQLAGFPIGTIIGGYILWCLLKDWKEEDT